MLWLLPLDAGPVHVRLDPGIYVVPRWYDEAELGVLLEVLRRVLEPTVLHALLLPVEAMEAEAWRRMTPEAPVLMATRGEVTSERRDELGRWAREHRHHVLVQAREDDDELATSWLERWVKPAVIWLLEREAWVEGHPLAMFGIGAVDPDEVARATEDPVELLWLLERMLRHRLRYAEQGLATQDFARSLRRAMGERCAEKLKRQGSGVPAALDVLLEVARNKDGWTALVGAGLGVWREGAFVPGPLMKEVKEDWAVVEVIVDQLGRSALSERGLLRILAQRQTDADQKQPELVALPLRGASSSFDDGSLAMALREGLRGVVEPPTLLVDVVAGIQRWEEMRWRRDRVEALMESRLLLRNLLDAPASEHRRFARIEDHTLAILTTTEHDELPQASAARGALKGLLSDPPAGWELDLWLQVSLECARRHGTLATGVEDLESAESQYRDVVAIGERTDRAWHVASAQWHLAEIAMHRGDLEAARLSLQNDVLPTFERLGDARGRAAVMGMIADILHAEGKPLESDRIRHIEQLPVYEHLYDAHSRAVLRELVAGMHQAEGDFDQALHILRSNVVTTFEHLGDVRSMAVATSKIAHILEIRGDLDQALQLLRNNVLPAFEHLGDVRSMAVVKSKIAHILETRGDLDHALQMLRNDVLPAFERLGDVRSLAITLTRIAVLRLRRGDANARTDAHDLLARAYQAIFRPHSSDAFSILALAERHSLWLDPVALIAPDQEELPLG